MLHQLYASSLFTVVWIDKGRDVKIFAFLLNCSRIESDLTFVLGTHLPLNEPIDGIKMRL